MTKFRDQLNQLSPYELLMKQRLGYRIAFVGTMVFFVAYMVWQAMHPPRHQDPRPFNVAYERCPEESADELLIGTFMLTEAGDPITYQAGYCETLDSGASATTSYHYSGMMVVSGSSPHSSPAQRDDHSKTFVNAITTPDGVRIKYQAQWHVFPNRGAVKEWIDVPFRDDVNGRSGPLTYTIRWKTKGS